MSFLKTSVFWGDAFKLLLIVDSQKIIKNCPLLNIKDAIT